MTFNRQDWGNVYGLTIDSSKVNEDLTDFPVSIVLSSGTGQTGFDTTGIFDELSIVYYIYEGTWNFDDKNPSIVLSNGNLKACGTSWQSVRATFGGSSGKYYWEVVIDPGTYSMVSVANSSAGLGGILGSDNNAWSYYSYDGNLWHGGGSAFGSAYTTGDTVGVALDLDNKKLWFSKNGTWQGSGSPDPATGTDPAAIVSSDVLYPAVCFYLSTCATANFGPSSFTYTTPSGFLSGTPTTVSGSYINRKKIAITTTVSGVETELYTEIANWNHSDEEASLWTKVPTIVSGTDTELMLYYDTTQSGNIDYVGDTGDTPAQSVWDSNFKMVQHMNDVTTSTIIDSTSNNNDGTKKGANEPIEVDGKVGKGQDFDGGDDEVSISASTSLNALGDFAFSAAVSFPALGTNHTFVFDDKDTGNKLQFFRYNNKLCCYLLGNTYSSTVDISAGDHFVAVTRNGTSLSLYSDGVLLNSFTVSSSALPSSGYLLGKYFVNTLYTLNGVISEARITNTYRSSSWINAEYNTSWNDLVTFTHAGTVSGTTYYFDGVVQELNTPVQRTLYFYRRDSGVLLGSTTSSGNGGYYMETTCTGSHFIVCMDDDAGTEYEDLIISRAIPYSKGWSYEL